MTLATRVIATILVDRNGAMVKGRGFASDRVIGVPLQAARVYANVREVDELVLLDVHATQDRREPPYDLIAQIAETCRVPLAYGGGVNRVDVAARVIGTGADKVVVMRARHAVREIADRFGSQAVVVSIDCGSSSAYVGYGPFGDREAARRAEREGAGEILLQSVPRDGTLSGYDLGLIEAVSKVVSIPVIASSGCAGPDDAVAAVKAGASAVAAGSLWSFTDTTPLDVKRALSAAGFPVRISSMEAARA